MHVLIATDGALDAEQAARYAVPLAGDGGSVTILTVVELNRSLLRDLRALYGEPTPDTESVGVRPDAPAGATPDWPGDDPTLDRYLDDQAAARTASLSAILEDSGVDVDIVAREGEDPAAVIVEEATRLSADVIVVGARGRGPLETHLGSTGTKLARHAPCPLFIIRP